MSISNKKYRSARTNKTIINKSKSNKYMKKTASTANISTIAKHNLTLKGGKYIDKGGFGCIIKPALMCTKKDKVKTDKLVNETVSKIIQNPLTDTTSINEIQISKILKKIDPEQHYYLTFNKYCYITENNVTKELQNRKDIINIHYNNDEHLTDFDINSYHKKKTLHDIPKLIPTHKGCHIDLKLNPLNIIMDYGGHSLQNIIKYNILHSHTIDNKKTNIDKCKRLTCIMYKTFINNFKYNFKHLLLGIVKMHNNKIIHRDIKPHNIMFKIIKSLDVKPGKQFGSGINSNKKQIHVVDKVDKVDKVDTIDTIDTVDIINIEKKMPKTQTNKLFKYEIRYIDFGLSLLLTNDYCNNINNIYSLSGTRSYISPELYIINKYSKTLNSKIVNNDKYILKKIIIDITDNVLKKFKIINQHHLLDNLREKTHKLYDVIKTLFANHKILIYYFGTDKNKFNGYLQKSDVYALGLTMFKVLTNSNLLSNNPQLLDLLTHMIEFNPHDRYNIIQCINHPYFNNV